VKMNWSLNHARDLTTRMWSIPWGWGPPEENPPLKPSAVGKSARAENKQIQDVSDGKDVEKKRGLTEAQRHEIEKRILARWEKEGIRKFTNTDGPIRKISKRRRRP